MASSNIKLFDENKGNMLTDTEFNISAQRLNGLQTGVASSQLQNKAMYQVSLTAYAIAQVMMQNGLNANDTDAVSTFVANLSNTMLQKVYDIATTAEAQAGVATGKWMSPALVKAAIDALAAKAQNVLSDTTKMLYGLDSSAVPNDVFVKIKQKFSECVNPNLLDNWYFGRPVNQRGQTKYTGNATYSIDRWWTQYETGVELISGGIKLSGKWDFQQYMDTLPEGTYTFSVLYDQKVGSDVIRALIGRKSGNDIAQVETMKTSGLISCTGKSDEITAVKIGFTGSSDNSVRLIATKLELGSQQTLAHQENGVWVLNEIPNYWEELLKCIQSTADASDTFANKTVLHTGNAQHLGFTKIAIGSYVGTGTYGSSNPNTLTFDFEPKIVFLSVDGDANVSSLTGFMFFIRNQSGSPSWYYYNVEYVGRAITWSGNTLSWYTLASEQFAPDKQQFNKSGQRYCYVALG